MMARQFVTETTRDIQARDTRARIYAAAWHLIETEGFDKVSVDRICAKAGVAKGSFYHHFHNKADLIVEGYSLCDKYFEEKVSGQLQAPSAPDRVVEFVSHQMHYAVSTGIDLMRQVYMAQLVNGTSFFVSSERTLPRILKGVFSEGQASGEFLKKPDADYMSSFVLRFSRGTIYDWCLRFGSYDLEAVAEESCQRLIRIFQPNS
ncbi:MAG: TetR/AcrR family transcriptional regulator [Spirochaetia bacterium]|jgi:AcrR family transcriptional regulator|nr:TetR/AcrR family transcriptional regulator [Spirochaetia bacterium]